MRKILKNIDKPLLFVTSLLFIIGLIMVLSSSNVTAYMSKDSSPYSFFFKQAIFLLVGLVLSFFMMFITYKGYARLSYILFVIVLTSQLLLPFFGVLRNNSRSWFDFGPVSYQPSEFMKVISIIFISYYYDKNKNKLNNYTKVLFPLFICALSAALMFFEPDLGTMAIYVIIIGAIFLAQPISRKIKFQTFFLAFIACVTIAFVYTSTTGHNIFISRQTDRFDTFFSGSPCDNLLTTGNQICNGYIAINNGGLTGVGLGKSTQKYLYLPEPYTDFIFCIIIEELGLIFGIFILLLYLFVLWRILYIGRKCPNNAGTSMCYGIATYIFIHIALNLLGLFGMFPMTGVPLPFMSYGGSFAICLIAALTVVQRVNIENRLGEK